jgi:hypothetical protein
MNELDRRRTRRRSAQQLFDTLDFLTRPRINRANTFGSNSLRIDRSGTATGGSRPL